MLHLLIPIAAGVITWLLLRDQQSLTTTTDKKLTQSELSSMLGGYSWPYGVDDVLLDIIATVESSRNPKNQTGRHRGLFQLSPESVSDYNRAHGTSYDPEILHEPVRSMPIVVEHFQMIAEALDDAGITPDHPDWAGLFYAAHNAGYSRASGLSYVASKARAAGQELTLENLPALARQYGATEFLYAYPVKQRNWAKVNDLYRKAIPMEPIQ